MTPSAKTSTQKIKFTLKEFCHDCNGNFDWHEFHAFITGIADGLDPFSTKADSVAAWTLFQTNWWYYRLPKAIASWVKILIWLGIILFLFYYVVYHIDTPFIII